MENSMKIEKINIDDVMPLSPMQEGLLFHYISNSESQQYFEQLSLSIKGEVKVDLVREAWKITARDNEMLRTVYRWERIEKPVQIVLKNHEIPISYEDISDNEENLDKILDNIRHKDRLEGIDIRISPLRVKIIKISHDCYEMIISNHHILYDGWSNGILLKEFFEAYNSLLKGELPLKRSKEKYQSFITFLQRQNIKTSQEFWGKHLQGFETRTPLPRVKNKQAKLIETSEYKLKFDADLYERVKEFSRNQRITSACLLYTAWGILLQKYANIKDVVFGTTVSGRNPAIAGINDIVGLFINTIPLRIKSIKDDSIKDLLCRVSNALKDREDFENTSLTSIKESSEMNSRENIFDSIVVMENYPLSSFLSNSGQIKIEDYNIFEMTNFDLTLVINAFEGMELKFAYNNKMFDHEDIKEICRSYVQIINSILNGSENKVSDILLLDNEEIRKVLYDFNETKHWYPHEKSICKLFEEQVERTPQSTALVFGNKKMSYTELNEAANRVAWFLQHNGVKENMVIGIMAERSFEMIIGIYGILKSGAAYVPIDPDYPQERVEYLLENANASFIITQEKIKNRLKNSDKAKSISVEEIISKNDLPTSNPDIPYNPDRLMYVLFTSGSTGNPKGAMVKSHSFVNLIHWFTKEFNIDENSRTLLIAPISFDLAQKNLYASLIKGGKICIFDPGIYDYNKMSQFIKREEISIINCSPSAFYPLIEFNEEKDFLALKSVKEVFLGGEAISVRRLITWLKHPNCQGEIVNTYGPTECTDISNYYRVDSSRLEDYVTVPVGKSIYNVNVYVLDKDLNPVPVGVPGELCIGGTSVGAGYYNDSLMTKEKFCRFKHNNEELIYRTGDLVKWLEDGNIDFIGRLDHQIKIRGFRVELGEIENVLKTFKGIAEAVVIDKVRENGTKYICAYYISDDLIESDRIKEFLSSKLPEFMVPTYYMRLDTIPLTPNGKINRQALPDPTDFRVEEKEFVKPENETELKLVQIWQKVLGIKMVGTKDNFFDIGGNSILLIQLHGAIEKNFPGKFNITDLFSYPTVSKQAEKIMNTTATLKTEIILGEVILPAEFFTTEDNKGENTILKASLNNETSQKIQDFCSTQNVELNTVIVALFQYLLFELSGQKNISVNHLGEKGMVTKIDIDIEKIKGFDGLFYEVQKLLQTKDSLQSYELDHVLNSIYNKGSGRIIPIIYESKFIEGVSGYLRIFDLAIGYGKEYGQILFNVEYNGKILVKEKVMLILKEYVELIELFLLKNE